MNKDKENPSTLDEAVMHITMWWAMVVVLCVIAGFGVEGEYTGAPWMISAIHGTKVFWIGAAWLCMLFGGVLWARRAYDWMNK